MLSSASATIRELISLLEIRLQAITAPGSRLTGGCVSQAPRPRPAVPRHQPLFLQVRVRPARPAAALQDQAVRPRARQAAPPHLRRNLVPLRAPRQRVSVPPQAAPVQRRPLPAVPRPAPSVSAAVPRLRRLSVLTPA